MVLVSPRPVIAEHSGSPTVTSSAAMHRSHRISWSLPTSARLHHVVRYVLRCAKTRPPPGVLQCAGAASAHRSVLVPCGSKECPALRLSLQILSSGG